MTTRPDELIQRLLAGEQRALARAITLVEDRLDGARDVLREVYPLAGRAPIIGITGPPGAGKSTLVDGLTKVYREQGKKVGVIAVDPSSTFSGGAVLGDRIRMQRHSTDPGVFIRSMATRGNFGGLASASVDVADLMDAAGLQIILLETVGVGQDEVEIVRVADVVLVVLVPGLGDDVQSIKAGIMEIPDIFVLNKADREGIERLHSDVTGMLSLADGGDRPPPPIVRTVATSGEGVVALIAEIARHLETYGDRVASRKRARSRDRLLDLLRGRVMEWAAGPASRGLLDRVVEQVAARSLDPHTAAETLLAGMALPTPEDLKLDHLGIAVKSLTTALAFWSDRLGMSAGSQEEVPSEGVRVAFLHAGEARIELLEPLESTSPIARFLEKHGEGIHHICLRVPDLDTALTRMEAAGVQVIPPRLRIGAGGRRIAFLHPRSTGGVLLELKEGRPASEPSR